MRTLTRAALATSACAAVALVAAIAPATADTVEASYVKAEGGTATNAAAPAEVVLTSAGTKTWSVGYQIKANGGSPCSVSTASPATLTFVSDVNGRRDGVVIGGTANEDGISASRTSLTFTSCDSPQTVDFTFAKTGRYSIAPASDRAQISAPGKAQFIVTAGAEGNRAPVIATQAPNATGLEGSALKPEGAKYVTGAFSDPDRDPLSIELLSGEGRITPDGNSFTWTHTPEDNHTDQPVVVRASDGTSFVDMTFYWTATNVAPTVTAAATQTGACSVSLGGTFTDPGTLDTHRARVSWGDGSTAESFGGGADVTSPLTALSHTYTTNGTFTATLTVTDDDLGSGTDTEDVATKYTAGTASQPIKADGSSVFKIGSTIPVKVRVTGCDGAAVSTLAPSVSLVKTEGAPITTVATNDKTMRYSATDLFYIYNLSTKNSEFAGGAALTEGSYTVVVSDPTFWNASVSSFSLRK